MGQNHAYLKRALFGAAVAWAAVFPVPAPSVETRQGDPILFSSPANDDVTYTNMPSLAPKPPGALDLENAVQAPDFQFGAPGMSQAPLGAVPIYPGQNSRAEDLRRNWTLLTPAEILGAATPEKIMGISERNAFGQPKNLTALERYTERQNQLELRLAKTNSLAGDMSSAWNFSGNSSEMSNSSSAWSWRNQEAMRNSVFDSGIERLTRRNDENNSWSRLVGKPLSAQPDTDMDRFRQLLNPGSVSLTPAASSSDGIKTTLPQTMLGSSANSSTPSRIGGSYAPLSSGVGKLPQLPRLPAAWMNYTSTPPAAAWAPQQAPWLTPGPQPFVAPQRKF